MSTRWFLSRNKQRLGPYSQDELKRMAAAGKVWPGDLIRKEEPTAWTSVGSVAWLADLLKPPVDTLEEVDDDEEPARKARPTRGRASKNEDRCYRCEETGEGKSYRFYCGFREKDRKSYNFATGVVLTTTNYRGMDKHGIFLCRACATHLWRTKYLIQGLPFLFLALAVGIVGIFLYVYLDPVDGPLSLIVAGVVAAILAVFALKNLYPVVVPSLERDTMERLVISLVKREFEEKDLGDSFFTTEEYDAKFV